MLRWISISILIVFVTWIIPLGAFFTAAQENKICNGRRAICLCTTYASKNKSNDLVETIKRPRRSAEEGLNFPTFGTNFTLVKPYINNYRSVVETLGLTNSLFVPRPNDSPREPVPKFQISV